MTYRRPFRITGIPDTQEGIGRLFTGPANYLDKRTVYPLIEAIELLYRLMKIATQKEYQIEEPKNSALEMVLALAALTASEAEALVTLLQFDQFPSARIHLRALSEHAEHVRAFLVKPSLAKEAYDATNSSIQELVNKMTEEELKRLVLSTIDPSDSSATMQKVLRTGLRDMQTDPEKRFERAWLSKWNHGDAVALREVANRLANAPGDLRTRINVTDEGEGDAILCLHYVIVVLSTLQGLTGCLKQEVEMLRAHYRSLEEEFNRPDKAQIEPDAGANFAG
jgi:hypothetical protein